MELRERPAGLAGATADAYEVLTPLLPVTDEVLRHALSLDHAGLGANDRVHVATCRLNAIAAIVTADEAFDGLTDLRRIDPLDREALDGLLAGSG